MAQSWRDLTFLHYSVEPEIIQRTLPPGLEVETFDGRAWVGLVPFWMTGIRPPPFPALPWLSNFPETNVRTYVHRAGKRPGVWFYSLDAARLAACIFARTAFGLPYFHARMSVEQAESVRYQSHRGLATLEARIQVGEPMAQPEPGSLEFFLIERYLLYAVRRGVLHTGQVGHPPYRLNSATVNRCDQTLVAAAGLPLEPWEHICYSAGVDVEVFKLQQA